MATKHCRDCDQEKPLSAFTRNRASKDGLAFYCAQCARSRHTASRRRRFGPLKTLNGQGPRDVDPGYKWCPRCDEILPDSSFPAAPRQKNKLGAYCKPCFNRLIEENREKNHGSARNYRFKQRYGITEAEVDQMFAEQNGKCGICKEAPAAHVDHDRATLRHTICGVLDRRPWHARALLLGLASRAPDRRSHSTAWAPGRVDCVVAE